MRWINGVLSGKDVWLTANLMLERYGASARSRATARADESRTRGNEPGYAIWKRVIHAIGEIQRPYADDVVH